MQINTPPIKIVLPFAEGDPSGRATIPVTTSEPGWASLTQGFPLVTRTPKAAGGIPPRGVDMNGILNAISAAARWSAAGAGYKYDSAFANDANVAGYPKGARVLNDAGTAYFINTADGNTTNPNSGGANWLRDFSLGTSQYIRLPYIDASTGVASEWIVQCGVAAVTVTAVGGTTTVTLPIAFPNAGLVALGNFQNNTTVNGAWVVNTAFVGLTQLAVTLDAAAGTEPTGTFNVFWMAIGR